MYTSQSQLSKTFIALCFCLKILIIFASTLPEDVAISCGSSGNAFAPDLRLWVGPPRSESPIPLRLDGKSTTASAVHKLSPLDYIPYKTARISKHEFTYIFPVRPGQKFIRLHFNHDLYKGFKSSKAKFTVKTGPYTLLNTLSQVLTSEALGGLKQVKEYCVNVEDDQELTITFSPARKIRKPDEFYAFINGIELVSMPTGLYFTPEGKTGARVVRQKYGFYIDNTTALETVQRLNIGGTAIKPAEDSGMFRGWDEDSNYLEVTGAASLSVSSVDYRGSQTKVAPSKLYQTTRSVYADSKVSTNRIMWKIPVDLGFRYLIRLHFSEFLIASCRSNEFSILINHHIVEDDADMVQSEGSMPIYRDYIVMMEGDKMEGKRNLTIAFQPKFDSREKRFHGTLNGLEVFKLSNPDNNLAGIEPFPRSQSLRPTPPRKKIVSVYRVNLIATIVTSMLILLNIAVYNLRELSGTNDRARKIRSCPKHSCRLFSIDEIRSVTNNFDRGFHIGSGGYGRVYKGSIDGGATVVAIKRLKPESRQGDNEFWTEIKMLSKIRHQHLVSLIGFCDDEKERILVYQYMSQGTLADHLFKVNRHGKSIPHLSWELRLKIVLGAAHGLYYLHSRHRVIHRDVKTTNILLDENWVAKISDFGLSKMGPSNDSFTHISTNVKGTFGYLDPEYFLTRKLTRKSDVYAFGVVLFEVLSGRAAVDLRLEEEQHSLAAWARYCITEGQVGRLIDPNLVEHISLPCLTVFAGIAGRCLHTKPQERPEMADVVMGLELALALQQNPDQAEDEENAGRICSYQSDGIISMDDITPPEGVPERINTDDSPGSDHKNAKIVTKNNHSSTNSWTRWWWDPFGVLSRPQSKTKASLMQPRESFADHKNAKPVTKNNHSSNNASTRWWWDPFGVLSRPQSKTKAPLLQPQEVIHKFSFQEIQNSTNNFHNSLIIGYGGSENVYRGYLDGGQKYVAIRISRDASSRQSMAHELQPKKENQMKSSETHVAFLIGYCETEQDMMLVYDYMANGTLHDQLHEPYRDALPWKQRLQICIGAAKGLIEFHHIVKQTTLHRDLRSTNIWLDESWNAKISDWGLSKKKASTRIPGFVNPGARGVWGHLDSDYIRGDELTEKSYVYSFGLIMFEVLFAEQDSDRWLEEDQVSLAQWIKSCMRSNLSGCVDPFLVGRMSPDSLKTFVETAGRCLLDQGMDYLSH